MSQTEMETRIAVLERELKSVKNQLAELTKNGNGKRSWIYDHIGAFADHPEAHEEAMRYGREWRKAQREDYDKN